MFCHALKKHLMRRILSLLLLLFPLLAFAADGYTVETVPNVRLQDARQYVSDPASLLSRAAKDSINTMLGRLESSTGIEVAVVMAPSIGEADAFDFGVELFRKWGIGKKKSDNGLLILYVDDQHTIRFVTGYGIEGTLPDATCKRIQQRYMVPAFKNGNRDEGMVAGVKAVQQTLDGTMEAEQAADEDDETEGMILFLVVVAIMAFAMLYRRKRPCPQCHQKALRHTSTDYYTLMGVRYRKDIYTCEKCGKVVVRDRPINDPRHGGNDTDALLTGMFLGSLFGRRHGGGYSGGGFSGGSFGGGSTGGGGAGSSW